MARKMWGNDAKRVYRAVVTITYPPEWSIYSMPVGEWKETIQYGPFLQTGPARSAVTRKKRDIASRWRAQAKRNSELPMPLIEHRIEASELNWLPAE